MNKDVNKRMSSIDLSSLVTTLRANRTKKDWAASIALLEKTDLAKCYGNDLRNALDEFFMALYYTKETVKALGLLKNFERTYVDDHIITNTDYLLPTIREGKKIIATFDPQRFPNDESEIVICYGDFPHSHHNLICNNPIQRHLKYFWNTQHDEVEYDHVWDPVDQIYIINVDERVDRFVETLRELRRMKAPFHRVKRFSAIKEKVSTDSHFNGTLGCAKSHLKVIEEASAKKYKNILVLEDDFCFTEDMVINRDNLRVFFGGRFCTDQTHLGMDLLGPPYDYDVCLLATSKYYRIEPHDHLVSRSYQECTTCAGYLISSQGMEKLRAIWTQGIKDLIETKDTIHACDRTWQSLQKDGKFFVFNNKMGFQRPSYSTITGKTVFYMD